ncbi:hypothetical protein AX16_010159 [Volvariella volvacea WC 439]|nr:hypothetical protein AX16_010159 [Volvariella volvacea WC 439]
MSSPKLVLVTGANGFLASHIVKALLDAGYAVRGTVRGARLGALRSSLGTKYPLLDIVQVDDVATGDLNDALKGVYGVIHTASPLAGRQSAEVTLNTSVEGTLNVLRQVNQAGIKKVVLTSTWGASLDPGTEARTGEIYTESNWGNANREEALYGDHDVVWIYLAAKILAERAAWKFAKETPGFDLATIIPPVIYGPLIHDFHVSSDLGTNTMISSLIKGKQPPPFAPLWVDVRDTARAHVAVLELPSLPQDTPRTQENLQHKRFLVSGKEHLTWKSALEFLHETRPDIKDRLPARDVYGDEDPQGGKLAKLDVSRAEKVLGFEDWIDWKKCLNETVDSLLELEKEDAKGGKA